MAIFQALQYVKNKYNSGQFLIVSDSLSTLEALSTPPISMGTSLAIPIPPYLTHLVTLASILSLDLSQLYPMHLHFPCKADLNHIIFASRIPKLCKGT